ncbi:MAG: hypothetical protein KGR26_06765, partial [Cyanobacteria bacterium REEB65]|nr:hypothetical protein [Cyanobacteria bacterium REEB65]
AVSLLGLNHPFGILAAAWLFAALRSGASEMQIEAGVSSQIISVLQALVVLMVSAEAGIRYAFEQRQRARQTAAPAALQQAVPADGTATQALAGPAPETPSERPG